MLPVNFCIVNSLLLFGTFVEGLKETISNNCSNQLLNLCILQEYDKRKPAIEPLLVKAVVITKVCLEEFLNE
jgi:hypothetical protein